LSCTEKKTTDNQEIQEQGVNALLNKFQIIGHLYKLNIMSKNDLLGIKFEIISIGRNQHLRAYFRYLNTTFKEKSKIDHDHFGYFKDIYNELEYDKNEKLSFADCLYKNNSGVFFFYGDLQYCVDSGPHYLL